MVLASQIATFFDMDVFRSQAPRTSTVEVPDNDAGSVGGEARGGYLTTGDPVRIWTITVDLAKPLELKWLSEAWVQSGYGALPVSATPPGQVTAIPVTIENDLTRVFAHSGGGGGYAITLREFLG